jgi:hypothetical protein
MYNSEGVLKGLGVLNRTLPDGTVQYADYSSGDQTPLLRFYILGFSEFYNKTYSGFGYNERQTGSFPGPSPWDYGIEAGTYYIRIWTRGYIQEKVNTFTVGWGGNTTHTIDLRRAGSVEVTVRSSLVLPGTLWPEEPTDFWLLSDPEGEYAQALCPPPRLRVYFYSSSGDEVGYSEVILTPGNPGVINNTAFLNFTGHNWDTDDIIYRGFVPSALDDDEYTLRAHTYGYVQTLDISVSISLSLFSPTHVGSRFALLWGTSVAGKANFWMDNIQMSLTENVPIRPRITSGVNLLGEGVIDAGRGSPDFSFKIYGFYGPGHFHYVDPSGVWWKDYGLDKGTYDIYVPEFGYDRRFIQDVDVYTHLPELGHGTTVLFSLERLIKIHGQVQGSNKDGLPVVLTWPSITTDGVIDSPPTYTTFTFDGDFFVHKPSGSYTVTISCPGYHDRTMSGTSNDQTGLGIILLERSGEPFP